MKRLRLSRFINGKKGVISILLAALMVPSILLSDALIETSRYYATVSTLDGIMDLAATSTLANYDSFLLNRFGLPAMKQDEDIASIYQRYYDSNTEGSLNAWEQDKLTVEGKYALSDRSVLEHEIMEFSKYTVPTDIAADAVMSTIEGLLGDLDGLDAFTACIDAGTDTVEAVDAVADALKALEELKQVAENIDGKKNEYWDKYSKFKNSVAELADAIADVGSKEQNKSDAQGALDLAKAEKEEIDTQISNLEVKKADIQKDYTDGIIDELEYQNQVQAVDNEIQSFQAEQRVRDNNLAAAQSSYNTAANELNKAKSRVTNKIKSVEDAKSEYLNAIDGISNALKDVSRKTSEVINKLREAATKIANASTTIANAEDKLSIKRLKAANEDLKEKNRAYSGSDNEIDQRARRTNSAKQGWNTRRINEAEERISEAENVKTEFNASVTGISTAITDAIDQYDENRLNACLTNLKNLKTRVARFDVESVSSGTIISDNEYYAQIEGYAPVSTIENALLNINNMIDQNGESENVWSIIKGIRSAFQGLLKVKMVADLDLNANVDFGNRNQEISSIEEHLNRLDNSMEGSRGWTPAGKLKAIVKTAKAIIAVGKAIITEIKETACGIKQLCNSPADKILLAEYLTRTCSNRCTYTQRNALTGYSYKAGGLAAPGSGSTQSFCGAEAEYLVHGKGSEYNNQANLFFRIYMIRLLFDIWPVINNTEVKTIAKAAGIVSFQIFTYVIPVVYCIIEPYIDTMVIVNGGEIDLLKSCIYLTPTGLSTMISRLTSFNLTNKDVKNITNTFKSNVRNSVKDKTGHRINFKTTGAGDNKDHDSAILISYRICIFVFIVIKDKDVLLSRFQDIIACECSVTQGSFDIAKSYTYLTATSHGQYRPFLSAAQIYTIFAFSKNRTLTRGY